MPDLDWTKLSSIAAVLGCVFTVAWAVWDRHRQSSREEVDAAQEKLEWKLSIESKIEDLKQEIEHRKEIDSLQKQASDDRLNKAEKKLDEVLAILIEVFKDEVRPGPGRRP